MTVRIYLRASTIEQDSLRAKNELTQFALQYDYKVTNEHYYIENIGGNVLKRPKLMELIENSSDNDIILIEKIDRLTRLDYKNWIQLKKMIQDKKLKLVVLDISLTHDSMKIAKDDSTQNIIIELITNLIIDIFATISYDDYITRKKRVKQGILNNKHKFRGKQVTQDTIEKINKVNELVEKNVSIREACKLVDISRGAYYNHKKNMYS